MAISAGSTIVASDISTSVIMPKTGGTFTGSVAVYSPVLIKAKSNQTYGGLKLQGSGNNNIGAAITSYSSTYMAINSVNSSNSETLCLYIQYSNKKATFGGWNDYAESRKVINKIPGTCVSPIKNGILSPTNERLIPNCYIVSDTWGQCIGEADDTPVAVMGRVLATPYSNPANWPIGAAVCSAPNGTIDLMTRDEIMEYPDRIIGTISEKPKYDKWYPDEDDKDIYVEVKGRIWIHIL